MACGPPTGPAVASHCPSADGVPRPGGPAFAPHRVVHARAPSPANEVAHSGQPRRRDRDLQRRRRPPSSVPACLASSISAGPRRNLLLHAGVEHLRPALKVVPPAGPRRHPVGSPSSLCPPATSLVFTATLQGPMVRRSSRRRMVGAIVRAPPGAQGTAPRRPQPDHIWPRCENSHRPRHVDVSRDPLSRRRARGRFP